MTEAICLIVDVQLGESCGIELAQHLVNAENLERGAASPSLSVAALSALAKTHWSRSPDPVISEPRVR